MTSSRHSCWRCCRTSRSASRRSAPSGRRRRRWWCSPRTAPASCTTRSSAVACTTGSATRPPSARWRSCWSESRGCRIRWPARWLRRSTGCASWTWPSRRGWPRRSTGPAPWISWAGTISPRRPRPTRSARWSRSATTWSWCGTTWRRSPPVADAGFAGVLTGFGRELRAAGVAVGTGDILTYCAAMEPLDPTDLLDLYWAGRATLVSKRDDTAVYDEVFRRYFLGGADPVRELITLKARVEAEAEAMLAAPATDPDTEGSQEEEAVLGWMASDVEALKRKSFAACTPEELAALRRIMTRIRLTPPRRRTRRTVPAGSGRQPDLRRMVRESMRLHGDPAQLTFRQRRVKLRPLILILDISGSMADYSRNLLQFAYSARQAAARVEVFCFGTRLTRVTKALQTRRPDDALQRAARE